MELRDLGYFLACCDAGSFTAAARDVHIVQSAMSAAIARLEHEFGVPLLDRSANPVVPTEHGAALREAGQRVLDAVQAARDGVAAVSGQVRGPVILGCTLHTGPVDLAAVLITLRERHPGVIVQLRQSLTGSSGNLRAVADGTMDVALTAAPADPAAGQPWAREVTLTPLATEPLVFVGPPGHSLAGRAAVSVADLAAETVLRFPPGWGIRETVDRVLGTSPAGLEIADYALMLTLVRSGFGTTLMPASALPEAPGLTVVPVSDERLRWSLWAAVSARRPPTAAAAALVSVLAEAGGGQRHGSLEESPQQGAGA